MAIGTHGRSRRIVTSSRALVLALVVAAGSASPACAGPPDGAVGPVSLDAALAAAVASNPELQVHAAEIRAQEGRELQEGLLPNPALSTEVENFGSFGGDEDAVDGTQTTVSLTQLVELGGKRGRRATVARLDGRLAGWEYERTRLDVVAATRKRFATALLAQERVALAERLLVVARETVGAVRRQVDAGGASPIELVRAEAAVAAAEATEAQRVREARSARAALAALWGGSPTEVTAIVGQLGPLAAPRPLEEYRDHLRDNPDLARFATADERARAAMALEEARRLPDVSVRIGSRRFVEAEANAFVAEVSVPLPIFNRNQGGLAEARARADKTHAEERAAAVGSAAALAAAYEDLFGAFEHAGQLARGVLPRTRAALAGTRKAHAEGALRYLDVLEAQRGVAAIEEDYLETLARYHTAAADLERMTGLVASAGRSE